MFSKEAAKTVKHILDSETEAELKMLFSDLIEQEYKKLAYNTPETEKVAALARIDLLRRLKQYRDALRGALVHG